LPLGPPTAPLPVGDWVDRTPCPPPQATGGTPLLAYDGGGRLFGLGRSADMDLPAPAWEWDRAARHFVSRSPCAPPASWPWLGGGALFDHDPVRNRFLLVTHTWNSTTMFYESASSPFAWTATAAPSPWFSAQYSGVKLVRDENRRSVVVPTTPLFERRDGSDAWTDLFPPGTVGGPHPETVGSVGYDAGRGTLVNVYTALDQRFETWELDVTTAQWVDRTSTAGSVAAASYNTLWWDPVARRLCNLALESELSDEPRVWSWDGLAGRWTELVPGDSVRPRLGQVLTFAVDRTTGDATFWLTASGTAAQELWTWRSAARAWTRLSPDRWPTLWPRRTSSSTATYDWDRGRLVAVTAESLRRVSISEWDVASETFFDRTSDVAQPWPANMTEVDLAYDPDRRRLVLFGSTQSRAELWEWDGATGQWRDRTTPVGTTPAPLWPGVGAASITYDPVRRRVAAWATGVIFPAIWLWEPDSGTWQGQSAPDAIALASRGGSLVADERRGVLVLVAPGPSIVEWSGGAAWRLAAETPRQPNTGQRVYAAYDARAERTLVFTTTSSTDSAGVRTYRNGLWTWDGERLVDITPPSLAGVRADDYPEAGSSLTYDPTRGNLLLLAPLVPTDRFRIPGEMHVWEGSTQPAR
jgi:hypothetical protein